jgi:hypothetical protein
VSISKREMTRLLSLEESVDISLWFVASDYRIYKGQIHPYHSGEKAPKWSLPLSHPELFLNFARLGAGGDLWEDRIPLSDDQILHWVREYGLLRRKNPEYDRRAEDGEPNQAPMSLDNFRLEVRQAYRALRLLEQIRSGDFEGLRERIDCERIYRRNSSGYYGGKGTATNRALITVDGLQTPLHVFADEEPSDVTVTEWATQALEYFVEQKLSRVRAAFVHNTSHERPISTILGDVPYRPRLTLRCPDLESALWFQLAAFIEDKRRLQYCEECGRLFTYRSSKKKTCSDRCRKAKSRRNLEESS